MLFDTWLKRQPQPAPASATLHELRREFFSKTRACLRTSPLARQYGWGIAFDEHGRAALCPMESEEYRALLEDDDVAVLKAMRSSRR